MTSSNASRLQPTAFTSTTLPSFLQNLLDNHATPTNLIICSSEADFVRELHASTEYEKAQEAQEAEADGLDPARVQRIATRTHPLAVPTIHQIYTSRTVDVTFCETLAQLQAYLAVHGLKNAETSSEGETISEGDGRRRDNPPMLILLNAIKLHRGTASFSTQGLSRTLASAVEAAYRARQKLVLVECSPHLPVTSNDDMDTEGGDEDMLDTVEEQKKDIWEEQLAILNVTTKSFGAGERGWVGRTVRIRRVVERWCVFG
jgi:hypothetical protein